MSSSIWRELGSLSQLYGTRAARAKRYWEKAAQARALAAESTYPKVTEQLLSVAVQFEVLAKRDDAPK
jgi:hypothetical protein